MQYRTAGQCFMLDKICVLYLIKMKISFLIEILLDASHHYYGYNYITT